MANKAKVIQSGWRIFDSLVKRDRNTPRTITVSVGVPGVKHLPDEVTLTAPPVSLDTLIQVAEVKGFLQALYAENGATNQERAALFSLCHVAPWNVMYSPSMLYMQLALAHPAVFERVDKAFRAAFGAEETKIADLVRAQLRAEYGIAEKGNRVN